MGGWYGKKYLPPRDGRRRKLVLIAGSVGKSPVADDPSTETMYESRSSGLPAHFSAFPEHVQWRTEKSGISSAYGGGSAPDLNGIPYEAPKGASVSLEIVKTPPFCQCEARKKPSLLRDNILNYNVFFSQTDDTTRQTRHDRPRREKGRAGGMSGGFALQAAAGRQVTSGGSGCHENGRFSGQCGR